MVDRPEVEVEVEVAEEPLVCGESSNNKNTIHTGSR